MSLPLFSLKLLKSKLTRIINCSKDLSDVDLIKAYLEQVNPLLNDFQGCLERLAGHIDLTDEDDNDLVKFENKYMKLICSIQKQLKTLSNSELSSNVNISDSKINLPPIKLSTFAGSYKDWIGFRDLYKSLVHDKIGIPDIQKLHYLKTNLAGDAAKTIDALALTANNYQDAWDIIQKKYERTRCIIESHIKSLINMCTINKNSIFSSVDEIQKTIRSLAALDHNPSAQDTLLIFN